MTSATENALRWDLSDMYSGPEDPRVGEDLARMRQDAERFRAHYAGRVGDMLAKEQLTAMRDAEKLAGQLYRMMTYATLVFSVDTESESAKALFDKVRSEHTTISNLIGFYDVELKGLSLDRYERLLRSPDLANYRYHLQSLRKLAPHTLTEAEESVAALKDVTGSQAWVQLYTEIAAAMRITIEVAGQKKTYTVTELRSMRADANREVRQAAVEGTFQAYADRSHVLTTIVNTLYQDHAQDVALRRFPSAIAPTLLMDDLSQGVIDALMEATESSYDLVQRYYRLKARALKIEDFSSYDTLAPYTESVRTIPFETAQATVLDTFGRFCPEFESIARRFFEGRWIDVPPSPGKRGGAFCAGLVPEQHPYLMLNYSGRLEDVTTLAHELGHGIHYVLSSGQSFHNYQAVTPLAETASTFGELVVLDHLLSTERDPAVRLQLLAKRLEDAVNTIFRQVMYTRWELRSHARRAEGALSADDLCAIWSEENARLYGPDVRMTELDRWGWLTVPHLVQYRFYCYSYAFGQLLVYALYQQYKEEGEAFLPKLLKVLRAGGSEDPAAILHHNLGVDITDPGFWNKGQAALREMLAEFEAAL